MISRFARTLALTTLTICVLNHASGEELLVLRNGYVLRGEISRVGDRYAVRIAEGSETRIPVSAVELRCRDFDDAYRQKVSRLERGRITDRIALIQWCLRHELVRYAEQQLVAAEQRDPLNPSLHQLRRRLESILEGTDSVGPDKSSVVSISTYRPRSDELDLLMRRLPVDVVEEFTTTVQPLLINRCSAGGCHGPSSASEFRLIRPRLGRGLERPFTQRNLHATLKTIDRNHPLGSPLAKVLSKPHGPDNAVNATLSQEQADQVMQWIKSLAQTSVAQRPSTISASAQTLGQPSSRSKRSAVPASSSGSAKPASQAATANIVGPDPFDPEEFNRRYHSKSEPDSRSYQQPVPATPRSFQTPPNVGRPIPQG